MKLRFILILTAFLLAIPMQMMADEGTALCQVGYVFSTNQGVKVNFAAHPHGETYKLNPAAVGYERYELMFELLVTAAETGHRVWAKWDKDHNLILVSLYNHK